MLALSETCPALRGGVPPAPDLGRPALGPHQGEGGKVDIHDDRDGQDDLDDLNDFDDLDDHINAGKLIIQQH